MILKYEDYQLHGTTVFERVRFSAPFKPSVTYDQEACFIYSVAGNGLLYGGIDKQPVRTNESILMKCGSFLNHWTSSEEGQPCEVVAIHYTPEVLHKLYENKLPDFLRQVPDHSNKVFRTIPRQSAVDEYIKGLVFYFDHPELINEELLALKLKELILLLYNLDFTDLREMLHDLFNPVELTFKSIVQSHLLDQLEIREFAALTNCSLSTFKRKFRQIFDDTPANYIAHQRLEKAAQLLRLSEGRITDICFDCGFNDLSTFSKSFSRKYGMSPSEYRQAG